MNNIAFHHPSHRYSRFMKIFTLGVLLLACWLVWPAQAADAHSQLLETSPEAGARLAQSPEEIRLTFNEAVETKFGGIELLDSLSNKLKVSAVEASQDRTSLAVKPSKLDEGVYTVTYRIISEDGHPVNGSYVFVVGNPPAAKDAATFDLHTQLGHSGHGSTASALTSSELVLYAVRFFYYATLLLAAGVMLWKSMTRFEGIAKQAAQAWSLGTVRAFLFGSILYVFFHAREVMEEEPLSEWLKLLSRTSVGMAWLATVVLSLLGFIVLRGGRVASIIWAILLIAVESWSGHAEANNPKVLTVGLDFVHLAAAALWAGGLALLLVLWFKDRKEAGRFAVRFSGGAVLSLAALVLTGVGMTLLFLPKLSYLWLTSWGVMLTIKAGLTLLVIVVGALLRIRVRRGDLPAAGILKVDGVLMAVIIAITALFTYVSPLPANEPVSYHQMGSEMHVSLRVTPNVPGDNKITLKIWLPDQTGAPKSVVLRFRSEQHQDAPIDIPLEAYDDQEIEAFDGYGKYAYQASGPYIPYPGQWTAEIRVMDKNDNELVEETTFRNY
ncbi:copper resistance protein C [Paenibacillus sp. CCS19]|uniref:copper resistance CopC/CopD family protein n=1 Tax=Paenibacillus sp. CCS19 TaxID=3158387 RepID=UPI00256977AD|nr:copper resistance protein CopC [Paenibacillus cellulosilyticus]GMK41819.1 copper resistance protein C [Paenibacillus cellulosilyticus]